MKPFISICVPAYKRVDYLKRLMDSLTQQTFRDFEVVVSDDSNDDTVAAFLQQYKAVMPVVYHKNEKALGTPANWNKAISIASGEWIKLMHDDDWFATGQALQQFANATQQNKQFIFCTYNSYDLQTGKTEAMGASAAQLQQVLQQPLRLFAGNVIGPPSVTLVHHSIIQQYDERMKWMVDFDFYIRVLLSTHNACLIPEKLVCIGVSSEQVTTSTFRNPRVELPEAWLMLEKYGTAPLADIRVYDAWWRLMRNLHIRSLANLSQYTPAAAWPLCIRRMLAHQRLIPATVLKAGVLSKTAMFFSYLLNRSAVKKG